MRKKNFCVALLVAALVALPSMARADDRSCGGLYERDVQQASNDYYTCLSTSGTYFQQGCSMMYGMKLTIASTVYAACLAVDATMREQG